MNRMGIVLGIISTLGLIFGGGAYPQGGAGWKGSGGWGAKDRYQKVYDVRSVETISGEVLRIERLTPMEGMSYGVHLIVKTETEEIPVHLGPGWFVENQELTFAPQDKVEIKGSRITYGGNPAIIAAEVKRGDDVLILRDEEGYPVWSGWRGR